MLDTARLTILLYGILVLFGGILGYVKAKSRPSLIAGLLSGIALVCCYFYTNLDMKSGLIAADLVSFLLLGTFISRLRRTKKFMPSGLLLILSLIVVLIVSKALNDAHLLG